MSLFGANILNVMVQSTIYLFYDPVGHYILPRNLEDKDNFDER